MAIYYLDSSAIVKRYSSEVGTTWITALTDPLAGNSIHLAHITAVEVAAALARQLREQRIDRVAMSAALIEFRYDWAHQYLISQLSDAVVQRAMSLADQQALRGYDAVQLASALIVNDQGLAFGLPALIFISGDRNLLNAASAQGLSIDDPNSHP